MKQHDNMNYQCQKCGDKFQKEKDLVFHKNYEHRERSQWNCLECSFQADNKDTLKNHLNFKHTLENDKEVFNCKICERQFRSLWHLNNHTRDEHKKDEECVYFKQSRCKFGNVCWKAHTNITGNILFTCFSCKDVFKSMNELMGHRKLKHIEMCKPCEPKNGTCRFKENPDKCWFAHEDFSQDRNKQVPP